MDKQLNYITNYLCKIDLLIKLLIIILIFEYLNQDYYFLIFVSNTEGLFPIWFSKFCFRLVRVTNYLFFKN